MLIVKGSKILKQFGLICMKKQKGGVYWSLQYIPFINWSIRGRRELFIYVSLVPLLYYQKSVE